MKGWKATAFFWSLCLVMLVWSIYAVDNRKVFPNSHVSVYVPANAQMVTGDKIFASVNIPINVEEPELKVKAISLEEFKRRASGSSNRVFVKIETYTGEPKYSYWLPTNDGLYFTYDLISINKVASFYSSEWRQVGPGDWDIIWQWSWKTWSLESIVIMAILIFFGFECKPISHKTSNNKVLNDVARV